MSFFSQVLATFTHCTGISLMSYSDISDHHTYIHKKRDQKTLSLLAEISSRST